MKPGRVAIHTLGCKANAYDSQLVRQALLGEGWTLARPGEAADLVVVNSCTVTEEADRQSRKTAARLARRHPGARVVVTGCGAEVDPDRYAATPGVDAVVGNRDKPALPALAAALDGRGVLGDASALPAGRKRPRHDPERQWPAPEAAFLAPEPSEVRTRVFLKVQEGCDAFCTFCIIPYARGPARSLRPIELVRQVRAVCATGGREIVLTGTALGDYGLDLEGAGGFEDLVALLLRETPVERLRLGSLDPRELSPRLTEMMATEPRLCPHAHVSLQSPVGGILKRMKRRYGEAEVVDALERLAAVATRRPEPGGVFVGMDVIAGFPGETEAQFEATVQALEALPWHRLHAFPYSEREGTAATRLDAPVPVPERKRRVRTLIALSNRRLAGACEALVAAGEDVDVLVEGGIAPPAGRDGSWAGGYTANYYRVTFPAPAPETLGNTRAVVRPIGVAPDLRSGDVVVLGEARS